MTRTPELNYDDMRMIIMWYRAARSLNCTGTMDKKLIEKITGKKIEEFLK